MMITWHEAGLILLTGIFGAPHCMGMCGGIVTTVALNSSFSAWRASLLYHAGRITSYTLLGMVMGLVGSFLNVAGKVAGLQGAASIIGGIFILLWLWRRNQLPFLAALSARLHHQMTPRSERSAYMESLHIALTGFAFGFLPCGLTYAMQMNAAASGTMVSGAVIMLLFGLSTFPVLAATAAAAKLITRKNRSLLRKIGNAAALLIGIIAIMRGLAANGLIPSIAIWLW
ncbi:MULTISPECIES: sulfite exporter TauE/SafE family protein [unclassified Paenibacillus]|uniref:sulfite exporter TauE/SafE family protein n=1 Tax=unclassified Paenibacillus TaxID=185978 RepID=UPI002F3E3C97